MKQITAIIATKEGYRAYPEAQEINSFIKDVEEKVIYRSEKGDFCVYEVFEVQ